MPITNMNKPIIDTPEVQQMAFAIATGIAGSCIESDSDRFIYHYAQTSTTAATFYRYDTLSDSWQQLATPPTGTGSVANMSYQDNIGGQYSGRTYGAIYLFVGNGTTAYFYKYDIATNTWSANLGTTGVPATFATDCYLLALSPHKNNFETAYHSGVTRTITTSGTGAVGATSLAVTATSEAMVAGTRLRFGTFDITLSTGALKGATSLTVTALPNGLASGMVITLINGDEIILSSAASAGATTISVYPIQRAISSGTVITIDKYVVLTATAASGATSLTVSSLLYTIGSGDTAPYYGNMYLIGNNATQMYRYNIGANAWATTSANSGNPALPSITGACGAGSAIKWCPIALPDKLVIVRGTATASIYTYDLITNTMATVAYAPATETFTTGSSISSRSLNGKHGKLLIQKESTGRVYELCILSGRVRPKFIQNKLPIGTATVGDRSCCLVSPDGIEFYYCITNSNIYLARVALLDS